MQEFTAPGANPLKKYFRQPKLYINLPSKGKFYPAGSLNMPETGELPVFPMTAKDILADFAMSDFESTFETNELKIHIRPLTYEEFTKSSIKTFEEQRIFNLLNNNEVSEEDKLARFNESFKKLTDLTVETLTKGIIAIEVDDQRVDNPLHITEFVENSEKQFFNDVLAHITKQREKFQVKPFVVQSDEEDIAAGAPETYEIPITFDNSNFFA